MRNFGEAMMFYSKPELWTYCLSITSQLQLSNGGIIAEFGVYKGESINFFAKNVLMLDYLGLTLSRVWKKTGMATAY